MPIKQPDWNAVRAAVGKGEQLFRRVELPVTEVNEETGEETTRTVVHYEKVKAEDAAKQAFDRIEADVERLLQELGSYQQIERELRNALESDTAGGAEFQRRQ